jgi:hypothetical protein
MTYVILLVLTVGIVILWARQESLKRRLQGEPERKKEQEKRMPGSKLSPWS